MMKIMRMGTHLKLYEIQWTWQQSQAYACV